jgi:uncharacterized protein YbcV (DUF1398 family)
MVLNKHCCNICNEKYSHKPDYYAHLRKHFSPENITFVATDAHKLVRYSRTDITTKGSSAFILPKKPLNLIKSKLRKGRVKEKTERF